MKTKQYSKSSPSSSYTSPYAKAAQLLNQIWSKQQQNHSKKNGTSQSHHHHSSGSLGGLKSVAYTIKGEMKCSKVTYAQCANVLRHKPLLDQILSIFEDQTTKKQTKNKKRSSGSLWNTFKNEGLFYVLLYELLLGPNHAIRGGGALKRNLMSCKEELISITKQLQQQQRATTTDSNDTDEMIHNHDVVIPRYVRINTVRTTLFAVVQEIQQTIQQQQQRPNDNNNDDNKTNNESDPCLYLDRHVPNLIVMPPTAGYRAILQDHVQRNQIILQDKSSCFSALCLVHGFNDTTTTANDDNTNKGDYLDACAAPGNKTSHLATMIAEQQQQRQQQQPSTTNTDVEHENKRKRTRKKKSNSVVVVHALDRSSERFESLRRRMDDLINTAVSTTSTSTTNQQSQQRQEQFVRVDCHKRDFLTTSQDEFPNVTRLLLDPSCSGSGMAHHRHGTTNFTGNDKNHNNENGGTSTKMYQHYEPPDNDLKRVQSLASFQLMALKHAMTKFHNVTRIVYSTCSFYRLENELVVLQALQEVQAEKRQQHGNSSNKSRFDDNNTDEEQSGWELVAPSCLRHWTRRGVVIEGKVTVQDAEKMIRVDPTMGDESNGFFVACLQRRQTATPKPPKPATNEEERPQRNSPIDTNPINKARSNLLVEETSKGVGIPFYQGEFQNQYGTKLQRPSFKRDIKDEIRDDDDDKAVGTNTQPPKKKTLPGTNTVVAKETLDSGQEGNIGLDTIQAPSNNEKVDDKGDTKKKVGKKRAKKLAWKQKQRERKRQRLELRQSSAENNKKSK